MKLPWYFVRMEIMTQADLSIGDTFKYPDDGSPEAGLIIEIIGIKENNIQCLVSYGVDDEKLMVEKPNSFIFEELKNGVMIPINRRNSIKKEIIWENI